MAGKIFISYRRDDAAAWAGRLHMALEKQFRRDQIFIDILGIGPGLNFAKVIDAEVAKCDVMLVVIGKGWLDATDSSGRRRLDDPEDFVRLEVESALRRDIRVVPVLVDGATLPKTEDLPEGMRGLVRRQAWPLSHARFSAESSDLASEISRLVSMPGSDINMANHESLIGEISRFLLYTALGFGLFLISVIAVGASWGYGLATLLVALGFMVGSGCWAFLAPRDTPIGQLAGLWFASVSIGIFMAAFNLEGPGPRWIPEAVVGVLAGFYALALGPALVLSRRKN